MPRAVTIAKTKKFDLESCPEGYVVLRRFNYGENLRRRELAASVGRRGEDKAQQLDGEVNFDLEAKVNLIGAGHYEFVTAIMEHNLTDENDKPLNFKNRADFIRLDASIADEIGKHIDEFNEPEKDEEGETPFNSNSGKPSHTEPQSTTEPTTSSK